LKENLLISIIQFLAACEEAANDDVLVTKVKEYTNGALDLKDFGYGENLRSHAQAEMLLLGAHFASYDGAVHSQAVSCLSGYLNMELTSDDIAKIVQESGNYVQDILADVPEILKIAVVMDKCGQQNHYATANAVRAILIEFLNEVVSFIEPDPLKFKAMQEAVVYFDKIAIYVEENMK